MSPRPAALLLALGLMAGAGRAEDTPAKPPATEPEQKVKAPDEDLEIDPSEPDFTVVNMPTTLRLPRHKWAFRLTHRFSRPLGQGDFGDLVEDLFGFDSAAGVGLEFRFAPASGMQVGIYRTNDKTIEFFASQNVIRSAKGPVGLTVVASVEGRDNFGEDYAPAFGIAVSRRLGKWGSIYVLPSWVGNTNIFSASDEDDTFLLQLGARIRTFSTLYLVVEFAPRLAGYMGENPLDPTERAAHHLTFGLEKRVGGHAFQLNFSNGFATTPAQIARGSFTGDDWYIGFNLTRRFF